MQKGEGKGSMHVGEWGGSQEVVRQGGALEYAYWSRGWEPWEHS
jgi:hypothetical protein